jgi:hypothetical protein
MVPEASVFAARRVEFEGCDTQRGTNVGESAGMASVEKPREYEMVIAIDCPWCEGVLLTDDSGLDNGPRCDGCGVRFELASDSSSQDLLAHAA